MKGGAAAGFDQELFQLIYGRLAGPDDDQANLFVKLKGSSTFPRFLVDNHWMQKLIGRKVSGNAGIDRQLKRK
jgi:hypothetical protein